MNNYNYIVIYSDYAQEHNIECFQTLEEAIDFYDSLTQYYDKIITKKLNVKTIVEEE